jgi:DNA-directed RNA polymerase specialized sigma24 family protein
LHYYRDLPVTDIAKAMGIKDATVSVHLHRGRQALAELLISYGPTEKKNFPDSV